MLTDVEILIKILAGCLSEIRGSQENHVAFHSLMQKCHEFGLQGFCDLRPPGSSSLAPAAVKPIEIPKGPKYQYATTYGFCSSNLPYGLGKYSPYKLLVSPLITPIVVPYILPYITPFNEFIILHKGTWDPFGNESLQGLLPCLQKITRLAPKTL